MIRSRSQSLITPTVVAHRHAGRLRALAAQRRPHGQVQDGARLRGAAGRPRGIQGTPHVAVLGVLVIDRNRD